MVMLMRVMVMILMKKIVERAGGNDAEDDTDDTDDTDDDDDDDTYDTGDDNDVASRWEVVMEATEAVTDDLAQCGQLHLCHWERSSSSLYYAWTQWSRGSNLLFDLCSFELKSRKKQGQSELAGVHTKEEEAQEAQT